MGNRGVSLRPTCAACTKCGGCDGPLPEKHGHTTTGTPFCSKSCYGRIEYREHRAAADASPLRLRRPGKDAPGPSAPAPDPRPDSCTSCGACGGPLPPKHHHTQGVPACSTRCLGRVDWQIRVAAADASPLRRPQPHQTKPGGETRGEGQERAK